MYIRCNAVNSILNSQLIDVTLIIRYKQYECYSNVVECIVYNLLMMF